MAIQFQSSRIMTWPNLVIVCSAFASISHAIRVDWNTNTGPIVPPTSTVPPVPKPPFRDPSPVWEPISNDIENPNPYIYVMPPPSRPRYNPDNVHDIYPTRNASPTNFGHYVPEQKPQSPHQNHIIHNPYNNNQQSTGVPQLSVQYIANFGNKYYAIVPANFKGVDNYPKYNALKPYYLKHDLYEKPNGKYNSKLKKYKAYETKQKHVPYYTYVAPVAQRSTNVLNTNTNNNNHQQQQQQHQQRH